MTVPEFVTSTDDVTLAVHDLGGDGPLLLMCHATGFCGHIWSAVAETLSQEFHCVTFDFRAHGNSTRPADRALEWQGMAEDVLAVIDAISPDEPVAAVGHSLGGASLILADEIRPGRVSKIWAFEPILFERSPQGMQAEPSEISISARRRKATFADRDEVYERYSQRPPLNQLDERALRAYVDHGFTELPDGSVTLCCAPEDEAEVFEYHNSGSRAAVAKLAIPLALAASGDGFLPAQATIEVAKEHPRFDLFVYDELSHFGPLEDPDGQAQDMMDWLTATR